MEYNKKILVVEDYQDTLSLIGTILAETGYEVVLCKSGSDALHKYLDQFRCAPHAGIIADLALGDINGRRLLSAIREIELGSPGCCPIRMCIMSASIGLLEPSEIDRLGINLVLHKPFFHTTGEPRNPAELRQAVRAWLTAPPPPVIPLEITSVPEAFTATNCGQ